MSIFGKKKLNVHPAQRVDWEVSDINSEVVMRFGNRMELNMNYKNALAFADIVRHHALEAKRFAKDTSKTIHIVATLSDAAAYADKHANIREI